LQASLKAGPQKTVDSLLKPRADVEGFNRTCDDYIRGVDSAQSLRAWWLRRMILTPHQFLEKMTLFWHDYFALNANQAGAALLGEHVAILRKGAMGNLASLLESVAADPAAFLSLRVKASRKSRPDEAFPRQFLTRYTVGPERCTERDIRETARAMTGWFVIRNRRRYFEREHDHGAKTVLGKTGKFKHEDVVRIAARHPATAANVVRKLYRWFVSESQEPANQLLDPLVKLFSTDLDISSLLEAIVRSEQFFSDRTIGMRIKRPVELAVGLLRSMEASAPTVKLAGDLTALGEELYSPPTVNGWAGGKHWISQATMIARNNLTTAILLGTGPYGDKCDPSALARRYNRTDPKAAGRFLSELLGACDAGTFELLWKNTAPGKSSPDRLRRFACALASQPEFQLA